MRVIKPMTLGLLTRPYEFRRQFHLGIAVLSFLPMDGAPSLLREAAMWQFLATALPGQPVDAGIPKARAEFLVVGAGHAPEGAAVPRLRVGAMLGARKKLLRLVGARMWDGRVATPPEPFVTLPIDWAHAYGGAGHADNPGGLGVAAEQATPDAPVKLPMVLANGPKSGEYRIPAGFGQIDQMWPARARLVGTHDDKWLKEDFPGFARDIDWGFFNLAPADQQFDGMLDGDEAYAFENLHPERPLIQGRLPGLAPRVFVERDGADSFAEIPLALSTVWFFPAALRMVMVHHGVAPARHELAHDVARVLVGADTLATRREPGEFREVMRRRLDRKGGGALALRDEDLVPASFLRPDKGAAPRREVGVSENLLHARARRRKQRDHAAALAALREKGIDPADHDIPPLPPEPEIELPAAEEIPAFLEKVRAEAAQREQEARAQAAAAEARIDAMMREAGKSEAEIGALRAARNRKPSGPPTFSAAALRGQLEALAAHGRALGADTGLVDATLGDPKVTAGWAAAEAKLAAAYLAGAHHQDPAPRRDDDRSAALRAELLDGGGRSWAGADVCGADLSGIDLAGRDLAGIWLDGADLTGADLSRAVLKGAVLAHAKLERCRLDGADLTGANLGAATMRGASFVGARLNEAELGKADLAGADFSGADLTRARFMAAVPGDARFARAKAPGWKMLRQSLVRLDARGMDLTKAVFIECDLSQADFSYAVLHRAVFLKCSMIGANFTRATLRNGCFAGGCDVTGGRFEGADLTSVNLRGAMLMGAGFAHADMPGADFSGAELTAASFAVVDATRARFADASMPSAVLRGGNFKQADFARADLRSADLGEACAYEANLSRALIDRGTGLSRMKRTRLRYLPLAEAP